MDSLSELIDGLDAAIRELRVTAAIKELRVTAAICVDEVTLSKIQQLSKLLSHHATTVTLLGSDSDDNDKAMKETLEAIGSHCSGLCDIVLNLPEAIGFTLKQHILLTSRWLVANMHQLISNASPTSLTPQSATGTVWSVCKELEAIPSANHSIVASKLRIVSEQVMDAIQETEELLQLSTLHDRDFLTNITVLLKTIKLSIVKCAKTLESLDESHSYHPFLLDRLLQMADLCLECVDDLVSEIHESEFPLDQSLLSNALASLVDAENEFLDRVAVFQLESPAAGWTEPFSDQINRLINKFEFFEVDK